MDLIWLQKLQTYTVVYPAPDGLLGLEGAATFTHPNTNPGGEGGQFMMPLRPKLLSPKYGTRIGTWNICTMSQTGKVHQIAREMKPLGLSILGVSQTRWTGAGKVRIVTGEMVLYSGLTGNNAKHMKGITLILSKETDKSLKEWEQISEHIITARFESNCWNTTVIQVYAPNNKA